MNLIKKILLQILIIFFFFETGSFFATYFKLFLVNETPRIYTSNSPNYPDVIKGRTEKDNFGAWHVKNKIFRHKQACFDVTMKFNEFGARDYSFSKIKENAIILLGDSFAEGFGVEFEKISKVLIEKKINKQILNFGTALDFGPLQEFLLYKEIYKEIPHQGIIIYLLPANDFTDNDQNVWSKLDKTRYRPYFNINGDVTEPFYFPEAKKRTIVESKYGLGTFLKEYFWSSNAIRTAVWIFNGKAKNDKDFKNKQESFYYDSKLYQQKNLITAYKEIIKLAPNKDLLLVIIPTKNDILRYKKNLGSLNKSYKDQYWFKELYKLSKEKNFFIIDLMEYIPNQIENLFHSCDGHWNDYGNKWAADIISEFIISKNLFNKF